MVARVLGINAAVAKDSRITADGMIVRAASLLGAMKYYDDRPGFMYRIHGSNRYINTPWLGRWYLRRGRIVNFVRTALRHFNLPDRPSSRELREEIDCRHFGRRPLRRMQTRFMYALGAFRASGPLHERARTALCALGVQSLR